MCFLSRTVHAACLLRICVPCLLGLAELAKPVKMPRLDHSRDTQSTTTDASMHSNSNACSHSIEHMHSN